MQHNPHSLNDTVLTNGGVVDVIISCYHAQIEWSRVHVILNGYALQHKQKQADNLILKPGTNTVLNTKYITDSCTVPWLNGKEIKSHNHILHGY